MATLPAAGTHKIPLLQTKLYIPPHRSELVPRPRLVERLNAGLGRKLTLVSAPAGFGKTTLVSEWIASRRRGGPHSGGTRPPQQVAWLSLDEDDNDLPRFLLYLVAALQTVETNVGKGILDALQSPQPPPAEVVLTSLINETVALPGRIVLVLDDYHLIEAQPVHDALVFLLEHLPPGLHLVLSTREDPPLYLARLRAQRQLTELRAMDLRFVSSEAAQFLKQMLGLSLSAEDVATLERRTEGWIAGLQLAALAMQGTRQGSKDVAGFIRSFTGSHYFVLDYLVEEVLEQQSESVQDFLLQTAILDRLTGSLCDVLTGQKDGQATLEKLERANLFIIPLDDERHWYRYHRLFADLLRQRLQRERGDLVPELHQRASEWYKGKGLIPEAVDHALAASDLSQAAELIAQTAWAMLMRGEVAILLRWLQALPDAVVCSHVKLVMLRAWLLALMGQLDDADSCLSSMRGSYGRGEMAAIRGYIAHHRQESVEAIERCREALELLPEEQWFSRGAAAVTLGTALLRRGDPVAASQAMSTGVAIGRAASQTYMTMVAMAGLGEAQEMRGRLGPAIQAHQEALQLASEYSSEPMPFAGMAYVGLAGPLYERNELESAVRCVTIGIELSEQARNIDTVEDGYSSLALLHQASGNLDGALEALRKVEDLAKKGGDSNWMATAYAFRSQWWLNRGDIQAAARCAQESRLHAHDEADFVRERTEVAAARVLVARASSVGATPSDEAAQAVRSLAKLLRAAEEAKRMGSVIQILALQALAYQAQSDTDQAMAALERALSLAEPEGYVRTFVDEGEPMARLLYRAATRGVAGRDTVAQYARQLLAAFPTAEPEQLASPQTQASESELIEPLSERELEVLQLIAEGLTNPEIADRLYLSLNTVKAHSRNIYGKLGVHSRTQAAARARALGLLAPY